MKNIFIIAEAGVNHNGSLTRAIEMIKVAANAGADAIKFQTFIPSDLATNHAKKAKYQSINSSKDESHLKMLSKLALPLKDFKVLKQECTKNNIEFMSTAFDLKSLQYLSSLGMNTFKIPSGEITNLLLIEEIAKKNRKIILSTGMSTKKEISDAIKVLAKNGQKRNKISILHCNSEYPTPMENINLNVMKSLSNYFNLPVGISDHTLGYEVPIAAAALGAKIIEKHFTLNKNLSGPDHKTSLSPSELIKMIKYVRNIEIALGSTTKKITKGELENLNVARKSIVALKQIKKGDIFSKNNLTVKRPGNGISPMKWYTVLGKKSKYEFKKDEIIKL